MYKVALKDVFGYITNMSRTSFMHLEPRKCLMHVLLLMSQTRLYVMNVMSK